MRYCYFFGSYNSAEGPPKNFKPFSVSIDTIKLGFIFTESSNEEIIASNTSKKDLINELIVIYNKWFDVFPFDLVVFSIMKNTFEKKLPLKYSSENASVQLFTPLELIDLLKSISNLFFKQINASTIFHGNVIDDVHDYKVNLILEKRRIKSKLGYPSNQNEFSDIVSDWLKDEQDTWEELTPILVSASIHKSDNTSKNSCNDEKKEAINLKVNNVSNSFSERKNILESLKPGKDDATKFHNFIYDSLIDIFADRVSNPKVEQEINQGRKRIDIIFNNSDKNGFFHSLNTKHHIKCPKIIIECKNYSKEMKNTEVDQINGRLNNSRGRFGIIVCRSIENYEKSVLRCKDLVRDNGNHIIVLEDKDILKLLKFRNNNEEKLIDDFFELKIDELIL